MGGGRGSGAGAGVSVALTVVMLWYCWRECVGLKPVVAAGCVQWWSG